MSSERDGVFGNKFEKPSLTTYRVDEGSVFIFENTEANRRRYKEFAEATGVLDMYTNILAEVFAKFELDDDPEEVHDFVSRELAFKLRERQCPKSSPSTSDSEVSSGVYDDLSLHSVDSELCQLQEKCEAMEKQLQEKNECIRILQQHLSFRENNQEKQKLNDVIASNTNKVNAG